MESETFNHSLRAFSRRTPFQSFIVELTSGAIITVDHPEAMVVRAGLGVYVARDGEVTLFDHDGVSRVMGPANLPAA